LPRLPHADQAGAAAGRIEHDIRQTPIHLHCQLQPHGLLAFDPIGLLQCRHVEPAELRLARLDQARAIVDQAVDTPHRRALQGDLAEVDLGGVVGAEAVSLDAGPRGIGGERRAGVAVGRNGNALHTVGLRHRYRHAQAARLERTGGQASFVLDQGRHEPGGSPAGGQGQERRFDLTQTDDVSRLRHRQQLAPPPQARRPRRDFFARHCAPERIQVIARQQGLVHRRQPVELCDVVRLRADTALQVCRIRIAHGGSSSQAVMIGCYAEVASQFNETGGTYLYVRHTFGRFAGVQVGWLMLLSRLTACAAAVNLLVIYLGEFWPAATQPLPRLSVISVFLASLAAVNYRGVAAGTRVSNATVVAKLLALGMVCVAGVLYLSLHPRVAAAPAAASVDGWLQAMLLLLFAYGGYEAALNPMGEARDPRRDAAFALFVALLILTALYALLQLIVVGVLADAAHSARPLADAARVVIGPAGAALISAGALISVYG